MMQATFEVLETKPLLGGGREITKARVFSNKEMITCLFCGWEGVPNRLKRADPYPWLVCPSCKREEPTLVSRDSLDKGLADEIVKRVKASRIDFKAVTPDRVKAIEADLKRRKG